MTRRINQAGRRQKKATEPNPLTRVGAKFAPLSVDVRFGCAANRLPLAGVALDRGAHEARE